jgi:acetylglutamate kinase
MQVIKIGGNQLDDGAFLRAFAVAVRRLVETVRPPVIVHGGGKTIAHLQERLGLAVQKVDGLRVTDGDSRDVVEMVLSGLSNKRLTAALVAQEVEAMGLSGVDRGLLRCRRMVHPDVDLGFVGEIAQVRGDLLQGLVAQGIVPVLSPISLGPDGESYNVNADQVAAAVAVELAADQLDFVSDVPGVLVDGAVVPTLTPEEAERLITEGVIAGGMAVKVHAALAAVARGVAKVRIVNLAGLPSGGSSVVAAERREAVEVVG